MNTLVGAGALGLLWAMELVFPGLTLMALLASWIEAMAATAGSSLVWVAPAFRRSTRLASMVTRDVASLRSGERALVRVDTVATPLSARQCVYYRCTLTTEFVDTNGMSDAAGVPSRSCATARVAPSSTAPARWSSTSTVACTFSTSTSSSVRRTKA
jgi:hypothetical protein